MKWSGLYLVGYGVFLIGALLALWKMGVLASIGPVWTAIGVIIAIGLTAVRVALTHPQRHIE